MKSAIYGCMIAIYFLVFSILGWYYIEKIDENTCADYMLKAQFCVFMTTVWTFMPIGILCCIYPPSGIDIKLDNNGFCTSCVTNGCVMISFVIYILIMYMSVDMYYVMCAHQLGIILMFEVYLPLVIAVILFICLAFISCCIECCVPKASSKIVPKKIIVQPIHQNHILTEVIVVQPENKKISIPKHVIDTI
jgi:hypothetical protein